MFKTKERSIVFINPIFIQISPAFDNSDPSGTSYMERLPTILVLTLEAGSLLLVLNFAD